MADNSLFALISARQRWLGARFTALAQNVANADTPDYRPRDLPRESFAALLRSRLEAERAAWRLVRTDPRHIAAEPLAPELRPRPVEPVELSPSGNGVSLPEELQKLAETQRDYLLAVNLYGTYKRLFRTVLGGQTA